MNIIHIYRLIIQELYSSRGHLSTAVSRKNPCRKSFRNFDRKPCRPFAFTQQSTQTTVCIRLHFPGKCLLSVYRTQYTVQKKFILIRIPHPFFVPEDLLSSGHIRRYPGAGPLSSRDSGRACAVMLIPYTEFPTAPVLPPDRAIAAAGSGPQAPAHSRLFPLCVPLFVWLCIYARRLHFGDAPLSCSGGFSLPGQGEYAEGPQKNSKNPPSPRDDRF